MSGVRGALTDSLRFIKGLDIFYGFYIIIYGGFCRAQLKPHFVLPRSRRSKTQAASPKAIRGGVGEILSGQVTSQTGAPKTPAPRAFWAKEEYLEEPWFL